MRRFKRWLVNKYLPAYAKETVKADKEFMQKKIAEQALEIEKLKAYISGIEAGMKATKKIQVYNSRGE